MTASCSIFDSFIDWCVSPPIFLASESRYPLWNRLAPIFLIHEGN
ncbi:uncharacterized protein METZ01_LOCUS216998, partial [marine metagenome]